MNQIWEYHKMEGVEFVELKRLGELGWELVAIKPSDDGAAYDEFYFKRPYEPGQTGSYFPIRHQKVR